MLYQPIDPKNTETVIYDTMPRLQIAIENELSDLFSKQLGVTTAVRTHVNLLEGPAKVRTTFEFEVFGIVKS